ncbi:MAG: response regulator transcription factor, partial [Sediminibacterium sp.]|nr:response regulator transcription factor [Sediminibacterium sp.]
GITASKELFKALPEAKVIALSSSAKDDLILQMIELGAMGYLLKSADVAEIKEAIYTVYNRKPYFCKSVTAKLTDIVARNYKLPIQNNRMFSEREQQIIQLICKEFTSKGIAETLHLSKRTVEGHRTRIMAKIGAKSIAGIITYAVQHGIYKNDT